MKFQAPIAGRSVIGQDVVAVAPGALNAAVDLLLDLPCVEALGVRSGEHLAAILLTALVGAPLSLDERGEVDLIFGRPPRPAAFWPFGSGDTAAVEVKSLPGGFRAAEAHMTLGQVHAVSVASALDVLVSASTQLDQAATQLRRKVSDERCSKNVFLVVHPFDSLALELFSEDGLIVHLLPDVQLPPDVSSLWVLWHPEQLVWWSRLERQWTQVLFAEDPVEAAGDDGQEEGPVMAAEGRLLAGLRAPTSPYRFRLSGPISDA